MESNFFFFNKQGDQIPFIWDESRQIFTGNLYFSEISVDLIENETIFILEKVGSDFVYPKISTDYENLTAKIKNSDKFKLFEVDSFYQENPQISFVSESNIQFKNVNSSESARLDVAFRSDEEGAFQEELEIKIGQNISFVLSLYSEAVGEDERFSILLSNLGEYVSEREEYIFRQSDINEELPDFQLLNQKRKELLLELHNIKPYFSAYKGLINIIKFFGYHELQIKERWKNMDTNKLAFIPLLLDLPLDEKRYYPSDNFEKLSELGLFYRINRVTEEFDADGLPIVEEDLQFSFQEVLIKLFGLKKYIEDRNIAGASRIIDIVGEITYFHKYKLSNWIEPVEIFEYVSYFPTISVNNNYGYIEDLRTFDNVDYTIPSSYNTLNEISSIFLGAFPPSSQLKPKYSDEPNINIGYVPVFTNKTFDVTLEDADVTLDLPTEITLENIFSRNFYRTKWKITKQISSKYPDPFEVEQEGNSNDLVEFKPIIKKPGIYDLNVWIYAYDGSVLNKHYPAILTVDIKEPDFLSWFRYYDPKIQTLDSKYRLDQIQSDLGLNDIHFVEIRPNELETEYRSFKMVSYLGLESEDKNSGLRNLTLEDIDVDLDDLEYQRLDYFSFDMEKIAKFELTGFGEVQFDDNLLDVPYNFGPAIDYLKSEYPRYRYLARPMNGSPEFIDCTSSVEGTSNNIWIGSKNNIIKNGTLLKLNSLSEDVTLDQIPLTLENTACCKYVKNTPECFGMDNTIICSQPFEIPFYTMVFFSVDKSKIAGKTKVRYTIENEFNEIVIEADVHNFCYRFTEPGFYHISVEIEDTESNKKTKKMNKHIRVLKPKEFEKLRNVGPIYSLSY